MHVAPILALLLRGSLDAQDRATVVVRRVQLAAVVHAEARYARRRWDERGGLRHGKGRAVRGRDPDAADPALDEVGVQVGPDKRREVVTAVDVATRDGLARRVP